MEVRTVISAATVYVIAGVAACVYARMLADENSDGLVVEAEYDAKMATGLFRLFSPVNAFMKLVFGYIWPFPAGVPAGGDDE